MRIKIIIAAMFCLIGCEFQSKHQQSSIISNESNGLRYVNPLVIESSTDIADPMVVKYKGVYYLFVTGNGGAVWSSADLLNWKYHKVNWPDGISVTAPAAFEYQGFLYLTGNHIGLLRSDRPTEKWELLGEFKDEKENIVKLFDPMGFVDEDNKVYMYFAGMSTKGIYGVELDENDLTKFKNEATHFFKFESEHKWERFGAANEYSKVSWIEAPWMTKYKGTYYLQYSACGTDWTTYAVGYYAGKKPLGPFTYYQRNPILVHKNGMINGTGHHCVVEAPDGSYWAFYNILYRNWNRLRGTERHIGMDRAGFDKDGNMYIDGPTETPQPATGNKNSDDNRLLRRPDKSGLLAMTKESIPLSIDCSYWVSSERDGRNAPYAFDNNVRTWWRPDENDSQPWIKLDLGAASQFDPEQEFIIDSSRILFSIDGKKGRNINGAFHYKIEISTDDKIYKTVIDKTGNDIFNVVEFDEIEPAQCRYVKLTVTNWPKDFPPGVIEWTVFGKPVDK